MRLLVQDEDQVLVFVVEFEGGLDGCPELRGWVSAVSHRLRHPLLKQIKNPMVDEEEDVFFGLNVVVERTDREVGAFRNLADARLVIPLAGKEMKRGIADLFVPSLDESAILDHGFDLPHNGRHGITSQFVLIKFSPDLRSAWWPK